jgi:hypothetical protein
VTVLVVPELDAKPWPSLGPLVVQFIQEYLTFGPGALRGQPAVVDDETQGLIYRMFEVFPKGHALAGHRRFSRAGLSLRKGVAKTEKAAWLAICELHPDAPVRTVGWKGKQPLGGGVTDPYIPVVAFSEQQSEELVYGAMLAILQDDACPIGGDFDLGQERIMRRSGNGKAVPLATSPSSRDGARTTFQVFDETHHMVSQRLKRAHQAMLANLPKRTDAWSLEVTTAFTPGEKSVAEETMDYARAVHEGRVSDSRLFFFHRQASDHHDLRTAKGLRAAVREASGPALKWSNIESIIDQWKDPSTDKAYLERVWLNRIVQSSSQAFDAEAWRSLVEPGEIADGAVVVLGFSGARYADAAALVATDVTSGRMALVQAWEKGPADGDGWEVPKKELDEAVASAFGRWSVWRLYAMPTHWEATVDAWAGRFDDPPDAKDRRDHVVMWRTNQHQRMALACRAFSTAIAAREITHDGDQLLSRHIGAANRHDLRTVDEEGRKQWVIRKERPDGPRPINAAVAAILSWQARLDALAEGVGAGDNDTWDGTVEVWN